MVPSQPNSVEPAAQASPMQSYLERLYLESRSTLFRILVGDTTADPTQAESLERIRVLIDDDEHLEACRKRLNEYFPGQIARMFNLAGKDDQLYPLDKLRQSIRQHVARRLADQGENKLDDVDLQAIGDLKGSSKLQQQLAYLVGYTPGKWLLQQELPAIETSRKIRLKATPGDSPQDGPPGDTSNIESYIPGSDPYIWSREKGRLRGLCFSGGGIRSATFNLGVLQGMAKRDMLRRFDYLSSVSGGGYIHQWLAAWIKREEKRAAESGKTGLDLVTQQLIPQPGLGCEPDSPEPIKWLRRYSNYLTPQVGGFSADFWVTVAIWCRNTFLNQIVLVSGLLFMLLLPRVLLTFCVTRITPDPSFSTIVSQLPASTVLVFALPFLFAVLIMAWGLYSGQRAHPRGRLSNWTLCIYVVVPFMVTAIAYSDLLLYTAFSFGYASTLALAMFFGSLYLNCMLTIGGGALTVGTAPEQVDGSKAGLKMGPAAVFIFLLRLLGFFLAALLSATICAVCVFVLASATRKAILKGHDWDLVLASKSHHEFIRAFIGNEALWRAVVAFGPILILTILFLGVVLHCGLVGRNFSDRALEWLARARAWMTMYSLVWTVWMVVSLYGPYLIRWIAESHHSWIQWPALGTWLLTTLGSVLAGKGSKSSGKPNGGSNSLLARILTAIGPFIYIAGLLLVLSWLAEAEMKWAKHDFLAAAITAFLALGTCLLFGWRVDVNKFSMHNYYRNRLARCYLGASNTARNPDPLTGGDPADLIGMEVSRFQPKHGYSGPLPILCATINISVGEELAWQERKAASFAFSPVLSGYYVPWTGGHYRGELSYNGFVPTDRFSSPGGVNIATAAAISGAAVSPDAGFHTSGQMAFLLTMFNARLGYWMENPRRSPLAFDPWNSPADACLHSTPRFAPYQLAQELLGRIGDDRQFIYLTDGGHFDNMGLYELVRRRCYEIVICDAEQDDGPVFEGIGMAIRKCRIDFGVEIKLDLKKLACDAESGLSKVHWITGTIRYPETGDAEPGRILYIKSSLTGKEVADVYNYRLQHPAFPQDSTTDQWFTESQFESYRCLGQQVIDQCPYLHDFGMGSRSANPAKPTTA